MEVTLSHVLNVARCDHSMSILTHIGPAKVLLDYLKNLVDAKVTG